MLSFLFMKVTKIEIHCFHFFKNICNLTAVFNICKMHAVLHNCVLLFEVIKKDRLHKLAIH